MVASSACAAAARTSPTYVRYSSSVISRSVARGRSMDTSCQARWSAASVGQQRHRQTLVAAQHHGAGDRRGAEAAVHLVERGVERGGVALVERQLELHRGVIVEVADRDADQRAAALADER